MKTRWVIILVLVMSLLADGIASAQMGGGGMMKEEMKGMDKGQMGMMDEMGEMMKMMHQMMKHMEGMMPDKGQKTEMGEMMKRMDEMMKQHETMMKDPGMKGPGSMQKKGSK